MKRKALPSATRHTFTRVLLRNSTRSAGALCLVAVMGATACQRQSADNTGTAAPNQTRSSTQEGGPLVPPGNAREETNLSEVVPNPGGASIANRDTGTVPVHGFSSEDRALAQKVLVAISTGTTGTTGTYSQDMLLAIGVTASNGVVTLTGTVASENSRRLLAERASAVAGVRQVENQIAVSAAAPGPGPVPGVPSGRGQNDVVPQHPQK